MRACGFVRIPVYKLMFVIVVVSCLMGSFLIAVVCMSDSLRVIYTTSSVPWPKRERSAI